MSMDMQGGHLGCPWTCRGVSYSGWVILGVTQQGPKAPIMALRANSFPQELEIGARSAPLFLVKITKQESSSCHYAVNVSLDFDLIVLVVQL